MKRGVFIYNNMRTICISGAIITFLYVIVNYALNIHFNLFSEGSRIILFFLNLALLVAHIVFFSIYSYRRKFSLLCAFWILNYLVYFWYQFKLITINMNQRLYQDDFDTFDFYGKIYASAMALLAISILVSKARNQIFLTVFALFSLIITLIVTKNWIQMDGLYYLLFANMLPPVFIGINYIMELRTFDQSMIESTKSRISVDELDTM